VWLAVPLAGLIFIKFDKIRPFSLFLNFGLRFLAQRCRAKGFLFMEKGTLVSGAAENAGAKGLAGVDSLGSNIVLWGIAMGAGGASSSEPGVVSGSAMPGSSCSRASVGSGWGSVVCHGAG
jgi:hypothetical protein